MNRIAKGFDRLAPFYDHLATIVFGKSMRKAQVHFLMTIPPKAKVLVLGGGTGWLVDEIKRVQSDAEIWYVDISAEMIRRTRNRTGHYKDIHLIHGTLDNVEETSFFNVVITHFFLDLFSEKSLKTIIPDILDRSTVDVCWLVCDFVSETRWHIALLRVMYRFFSITCGLEAVSLPDWKRLLIAHGLANPNKAFFFRRFICSAVFQRRNLA